MTHNTTPDMPFCTLYLQQKGYRRSSIRGQHAIDLMIKQEMSMMCIETITNVTQFHSSLLLHCRELHCYCGGGAGSPWHLQGYGSGDAAG